MAADLGRDELLSLIAGGALAVPILAGIVALILAIGQAPSLTARMGHTTDGAMGGRKGTVTRPAPTPMAVPRRTGERPAGRATKAAQPLPAHSAPARATVTARPPVSAARKAAKPAGKTRPAVFAALGASYDDVRNKTWYTDKTTPSSDRAGSGIYCYVGAAPGAPPELRLRVRWVTRRGPLPLELAGLYIEADRRGYVIDNRPYGLLEVKRNMSMTAEQAWEYYDVAADSRRRAMLRAIASAASAHVRYNGRKGKDKHVITAAEKAAIARVLAAYDSLAAGG